MLVCSNFILPCPGSRSVKLQDTTKPQQQQEEPSVQQYKLELFSYIDKCLISPANTYTFPSLDKLYLYELAILVCNNLDPLSFQHLNNRISGIQLGGKKDTPTQLFRELIRFCVLSLKSLELLKEWLIDIGRTDIVFSLNQEQGDFPHSSISQVNM